MGVRATEYIKNKLLHTSCRDLIWLANILPTIGGFAYNNEKIFAAFWIIHMTLLCYVYIFVTVIYQKYYANSLTDTVNSFLNVSVFILIFNGSMWMLMNRSNLKMILQLATKNDDLVKETSAFVKKQRVYLQQIKVFLIIYYVFHFIIDVCIYIPSRIAGLNDSTIATCIGLEPLTVTPNREACALILTFQEITSIVAVVGYDVNLIFLLAHTTAMYNILCEDVMSLNDVKNCHLSTSEVSKRLKYYIVRHSFLLETVKRFQAAYSSALGIGFGDNAMSMSLFLFMPLDFWIDLASLVSYSCCVFFLYCLQGQRLSTATERLEIAVYSCGWENFNCKEQKLVLFMLKQAQRPVILLAANVVPIRIYTFARTMQSIYRFFMVFKL